MSGGEHQLSQQVERVAEPGVGNAAIQPCPRGLERLSGDGLRIKQREAAPIRFCTGDRLHDRRPLLALGNVA